MRGIHGSAGMGPPPKEHWEFWVAELKAMGIKWYKQLDSGDPNDLGAYSTFGWGKYLRYHGITPIIRFYVHRQFPNGLPDSTFKKMRAYATEGILYAELGNEPNLPVEWQTSYLGKLSWHEPNIARILAETWVKDAIKTAEAGMRPGFYAMAPTDWGAYRPHPMFSSVMFYDKVFGMINSIPGLKDQFLRLFKEQGAWLAVHSSTYEHRPNYNPWQDPPYDMCLRGYEIPIRMLSQILGLRGVKVMSTEGGVFCMDSQSMAGHQRLSSHEEHGIKTVEMFDWLQKDGTLSAMTPWLLCNEGQYIGHYDQAWSGDGWYRSGLSRLPIIYKMRGY